MVGQSSCFPVDGVSGGGLCPCMEDAFRRECAPFPWMLHTAGGCWKGFCWLCDLKLALSLSPALVGKSNLVLDGSIC